MTGAGLLYKAEATGDHTYRGTDPAAYDQVFDLESGDDDLAPLIEFLQFVNDSSDADFASGPSDRPDAQSFATYSASATGRARAAGARRPLGAGKVAIAACFA